MRTATGEEKELFDLEGVDFSRCTCLSCPVNDNCEFAFDLYNYDGDCLEEK